MSLEILSDIILVNKPRGMSSFDCIRILRPVLKVKKIGHAGTLDPRAEGLLILGVGSGTKKLTSYIGLDKEYEATIRLGVATDTGDLDGVVTEECVVSEVSQDAIVRALDTLVGEHEYEVPVYSAIKRNGKPLYKYVREGLPVPRVVRSMNVYSYVLIGVTRSHPYIDIQVTFHVASGVYIRSLAVAVGKILKCPAVLEKLVRTRVGDFSLEDAYPLSLLTKEVKE